LRQVHLADSADIAPRVAGRACSMGMHMSAIEPWAAVDDVARHLGVAKDSVYRWIERRSLPAHRIGRLWKFKLSEVDTWVRQEDEGAADAARATPIDG